MSNFIKPKYGYLYLAFIGSLAIVIVTSFLFHQRMNKMNVEEGYFNTISIWAGVVTLVSFYFIHKEVRTRSRYQQELEKKLAELNRSNSELEQFAYIASHDLQEPLRKIRTFTDKLVYRHAPELGEEPRQVIRRIEASAIRMQELIHDMLTFTSLIDTTEQMTKVDLNAVINGVLEDFRDTAQASNAEISIGKLPVITGNIRQLMLLFRSLVDNAFKFSKPGEPPRINISYSLVTGSDDDEHLPNVSYHKIVLEDRGIGFNNKFAEKIFMMFQRLHTQQSGYRGKGVGLAIAQRIMTNHNGTIMARGMINDGASFLMYFPAK